MGIAELIAILLALLIGLIAAGLGRTLTARLRPESASFGEALVFDAAIGLGALAYLVFALGLAGLLTFPMLLGLLVAAAVFSTPSLVALVRESVKAFSSGRRSASGNMTIISVSRIVSITVITATAALALIVSLAPPAMSDWDGLAYHLAIPKLYLAHGRIFYVPFASHSNFPFTVEMLFTLGLGLKGPALAKLFHLMFGGLALATVYLTTRRHFGSGPAWFSALLFAGMPIVPLVASMAYVDLATALYTIVAAAAILAFAHPQASSQLQAGLQDRKWLAIGAICAGFAAGTKMTALASVVILAVWAGLEPAAARSKTDGGPAARPRAFSLRSALPQAIAFVVVALVIASPWYIKSYVYTGNPVYPFLYDTFGGRNWSAEIATDYRRLQQQFGVGHGILDFVRLPWDLVFHSDAFYDRPGMFVGPALLAMLPLSVPAARRDRRVLKLGVLSFVLLTIWFFLSQQSRYLLPAFGIAAIGAAGALAALPRLKLARAAVLAAALVSSILTVLILRQLALDSARVVFGSESQSAYLARRLDNYRAANYINQNTPAGSKVILYGDTRGFYLDGEYLWGDPGHNALVPYETYGDASDLVRGLRKMGVTHALVNFRYFGREGRYVDLVNGAISTGLFEEVYRDPEWGVAVFRLKDAK